MNNLCELTPLDSNFDNTSKYLINGEFVSANSESSYHVCIKEYSSVNTARGIVSVNKNTPLYCTKDVKIFCSIDGLHGNITINKNKEIESFLTKDVNVFYCKDAIIDYNGFGVKSTGITPITVQSNTSLTLKKGAEIECKNGGKIKVLEDVSAQLLTYTIIEPKISVSGNANVTVSRIPIQETVNKVET